MKKYLIITALVALGAALLQHDVNPDENCTAWENGPKERCRTCVYGGPPYVAYRECEPID